MRQHQTFILLSRCRGLGDSVRLIIIDKTPILLLKVMVCPEVIKNTHFIPIGRTELSIGNGKPIVVCVIIKELLRTIVIANFIALGKFMIGLVDGQKQKQFTVGSIHIGIILLIMTNGGMLLVNTGQEKKWNNIGQNIIGENNQDGV